MRKSLVERARKRVVVDGKSPDTWVVKGIPGLGDKYDDYLVRVDGHGDYVCDCHDHGHGEYRARTTCSHVTAVVLYRQGNLPQPKKPRQEPNHYNVPTNEWEISFKDGKDPKDSARGLGDAPTSSSSTDPSALTEDEGVGEASAPTPSLDTDLTPSPFPLPSSISTNTSDPPMPAKFSRFEHEQWPTIEKVIEAFDAGFKVVMLDAPTGSGKTLIAEAVRRIMGVRAIYTCTTKTLQAQVMKPDDFGAYAKIVMGRRNYPTLNNPAVTAEDCTMKKRSLPACEKCPGWTAERNWRTDKVERKMAGQTSLVELEDDGVVAYHCNNCHPAFMCPYEIAKREAGMARLAVLNTAYFLAENTYNQRKTPFKNWPLVILDEADRLEEELMRFVEVEISPRVRKQLGIGLPAKKTDDEEWVRWLIEEVVPAIQAGLKDLIDTAHDELDLIRKRKTLTRLLDSVQWLISIPEKEEGAEVDPEPVLQSGWVYTGYEKKEDYQATVTFKPVEVGELAQQFLWRHAQKFLIMSASFVSAEDTAAELGLAEGEWTVITMPSTFPAIQRPIFPVDVASVTNKTKETAYPLIARSIEKILDRHDGERVLVHTVSYDLGNTMLAHLTRTRHRSHIYTYTSAENRAGALRRYLEDPRGVLLAPSFDRGVDLPKDDCRVIIIPKVPFGNLGDKQISTRFWGTGKRGKVWYKKKAIQTLCQMTGRGMRSVDDSCVTYVLDSEFDRLYAEARRMFPAWWSEGIVWDGYDPRWKGLGVSAEGLK
jgi:ATP-dependent DNA helicase DinG